MFSALGVCVIALHSLMPFNLSDALTNSRFQCSHHGFSLEMYKKEEEAAAEDKQRAGPAPQMDWLLKYISYHIKLSSGPWYLNRGEIAGLPKAPGKQLTRCSALLHLRKLKQLLYVVVIQGWNRIRNRLISWIYCQLRRALNMICFISRLIQHQGTSLIINESVGLQMRYDRSRKNHVMVISQYSKVIFMETLLMSLIMRPNEAHVCTMFCSSPFNFNYILIYFM